METTIVICKIKVGLNAKTPLNSMCKSALKYNYNAVWPWEFVCKDCKTRWGGAYISVDVDMKKVSCSNCYSDNIILTKYKIEVCTKEDFE